MSIIAAGVASLIAILAPIFLSRTKAFCQKILNVLIIIPMAIPASTLGVNLITAFNKRTFFFLIRPLVGTYSILPIAYILLQLLP